MFVICVAVTKRDTMYNHRSSRQMSVLISTHINDDNYLLVLNQVN